MESKNITSASMYAMELLLVQQYSVLCLVFYECAWCCTVGESGLLLRLLQFCALKMVLLCRRFTMLLIHIQGRCKWSADDALGLVILFLFFVRVARIWEFRDLATRLNLYTGNTMEGCVSANGKALFREQLYEGSISWYRG
ncbi:uncharacterized protein LOC124705880 [Lolium rigidum]|uniref:uncharacterized protein LOC124705880 n=1 Tax=Lolium rigidum TaxID=89674 RepID=UPI001F5D833B|nr:uncharacterized protein LOC124705880 [Lolium rigidum]XP_047093528.1 uncharacterized protein LOC124705880 [Lolium rigidum]